MFRTPALLVALITLGLVMSRSTAEVSIDGPAAFAKLAADAVAQESVAVQGKDDWLFLVSELRSLGASPFWGENAVSPDADPVASMVDLNQKLKALGIELILCPAPPRAVIYPEKLIEGAGATRLDTHLQAMYAALTAQGVTVLDVTDAMISARANDADLGPVSCEQDTHWTPRGMTIAAKAVADHIKAKGWADIRPTDVFKTQEPETLSIKGDLVDLIEGHAATLRPITIQRITEPDGSPLVFDEESPVLLLADSHGLVFSIGDDMHASSAGFGEHLSAQLGFKVDRMARRGSGDQIRMDLARRFLKAPAEAAKKRVLVYTFAARTFSESIQWKPVPLTR